jgi:aspartyl-tRNA(Asn)/glutamyl-tRNA(Gln) amidotransferase subunit B
MTYETIIGLEIHVQLNTRTKTFCSCSTEFGAPPNSQTCPVCLGLPGALPVLNIEALKKGIVAGLALECEIPEYSVFARKNYFYPDLPKAYQISQYEFPLNKNGHVTINDVKGREKKIGIVRAHLEEDAGKLVHDEDPMGPSFVDLNRCGVPLLEIVTEPDLRSPGEAYLFLQAVKEILQYTAVSECNMEKGELRVDVNVSLREQGEDMLGVKQEIKNMNSFANVKRALEYEIKRQTKVLRSGGTLNQQTRLFDQSKNATITMRTKEEAHDYRYFPDPDLVPVVIDRSTIEEIRINLPELPEVKRMRFVTQFGLTEYDAATLCGSYKLANYFEKTARGYSKPKRIANWIQTEFMRVLNEQKIEIDQSKVSPPMLRELFDLMDDNVISGKIAKEVFDQMMQSGRSAARVVEEKSLKQLTNPEEISIMVDDVLRENQQVVSEYKNGKQKVFGYLVGQVMKKTRGKANPALVNNTLKEKIKNL